MSANTVTTVLNYFVPPADGEKPYFYAYAHGDGPSSNYGSEPHNVQIEDLRGKEDSVTLDKNGFLFFRDTPKHKSFLTEEEIKAEYYPESEALLKKLTGATRVVFFDHTLRRRVEGVDAYNNEDPSPRRQPVPRVHVDQSGSAAYARVHRHLPPDDAVRLVKGRFQIVNLWRPISHPAFDWPLALCEYSSINPEQDLIPVALKYPDRDGETLGVKYNPDHKWKYVSGLTPQEGVLIKCFDSINDGSVAVLTAHTAFADPTTPPDAPPRESIELRALVFYE